jgi:hypothetical protein
MIANGVTIAEGLGTQDRVVATAGAFLQEGEMVNASAPGIGSS